MSGPQFVAPRHIVIEGPIRVGKSTLAKALAEKLQARRIIDCEGSENPFLSAFYEERTGAAFSAQMYFLLERHRLLQTRGETGDGLIVSDFLFERDKIFAYLNLDNEELKLYEKYFAMLAPTVAQPDLVIYLQAKPEVLSKRVERKGDPAEREISPEYLEAVAGAYEHFFFRYSGANLLVVDTSEIDFVQNNDDLQELLRRLQQPVQGTQYFLPLGPS